MGVLKSARDLTKAIKPATIIPDFADGSTTLLIVSYGLAPKSREAFIRFYLFPVTLL